MMRLLRKRRRPARVDLYTRVRIDGVEFVVLSIQFDRDGARLETVSTADFDRRFRR